MKKNKKIKKNNIIRKFFLIFLLLILLYGNRNKKKTFEILFENQYNDIQINKHINLDYENPNFAIIRRTSCMSCGLFSNYVVFLGCIRNYLNKGFIPIIELESYKNVMNGFKVNPLKGNPWEYYFNQPFGLSYLDIKKKAKNIKYVECRGYDIRPSYSIFLNKKYMEYWHIIANKYIPIKDAIIKESNNIINNIFKGKRNILGVLLRGTDYISKKPSKHPIPPNTKDVINDVKFWDNKNKYDWIFLATEDNIIRQEFIRGIGNKVKLLLNKREIIYNYTKKEFLAYNGEIKKNDAEFNKIYLLNIIILSKCLDFIGASTSGTIGIFILTNGFRNCKVYDLGYYK